MSDLNRYLNNVISCTFHFLDHELQLFSHDLSFDMSTYDSFRSY